MRKIVLYGAVVGTCTGTLSGFLNGTAYGVVLGIAVFMFYTAICSCSVLADKTKNKRKQ